MGIDATSRWRQAVKLLVVLLVVGPLLVRWGFVGADVVPTLDTALLPTLDSEILVRVVGLAIVLLVGALLVRQKRRSRGRRPTEGAPERPDDRQVEGTGEVYAPYAYNEQQKARREGERIRERAEEIAEADRDARKRR